MGLDNLKKFLLKQRNDRENLVRNHFGLFIECAEGLD
jgi:hypothetical protein